MKKIFSLTLAIMLLVSALPVAYAAPEPCGICGKNVTACPVGPGVYRYCSTCDICYDCGYSTANENTGAGGPSGETPSIPEVGTTTVTLVGSETKSYYEVAVPASMAPGGNADITVEGHWTSDETLKVTAPEKVTLYYGDQSMDVAIDFDGISQVGNDKVDSTATANLKIADASVKFGTWTGVIEYTVELV